MFISPTKSKPRIASPRRGRTPAWRTLARLLAPEPVLAVEGVRVLASQDNKQGERTTVRARRRRPTGPREPRERERAKAPQRRRDESGAGTPPGRPPSSGRPGVPSTRPPRPSGGGGGFPTGGLPIPGGLSPRAVLILLVLGAVFVCAYFAITRLWGSGQGGEDAFEQPIGADLPTATPHPFTLPPSTSGDQTWLVMLYQDADDKILEQDIYFDLNEAERVGSSERLHIVAQVDRFSQGYQGDGDWTSTKRFYVMKDDDLERVGSHLVQDLGEVNMAAGESLVDFAEWAIAEYPADKHVLILSDHGMGWPGGWTDPAPGGRGSDNVALAEHGDQLFLMELDRSLEQIRSQTTLDKFELIGLDACLMGHVEVFSALAPHARYAVASQETEPALGWAYAAFLRALQQNPDMNGAELGSLIVQSYIQEDERLVDPEARAGFLGQSSPLSGFLGLLGGTSPEQLAEQMQDDITLTVVDLGAMPELTASLNNLAFRLSQIPQQPVASARTYAQSFTSVFGSSVPPSYLDLANFAQLVQRESGDSGVSQAVNRLLAAVDRAVVAEKHGRKKPGAHGISIYFPNSQLYGSRFTGPDSYTTIAHRFAAESLWDDFLAYHYTGRTFEATAGDIAIPDPGQAVRGPGAGPIEIEPISTSATVVSPDHPVLLSTQIRGQNLGYVYLFVGFIDEAANSIFIADRDYLESETTRELDGVHYPSWGESGAVSLEFEWEPIVYAIDDGVNPAAPALFSPEDYGASAEEAVYTVDGLYSFADGTGSRNARLYFTNGVLKQVYGFTGQGEVGAPREIIPASGDTFTVLEKWLDLGADGAVVGQATQTGDTITFSDAEVYWVEQWAAAGQYIVGFIVEDLDGNAYAAYTRMTVE